MALNERECSVSEIVSMHEGKKNQSDRNNEKHSNQPSNESPRLSSGEIVDGPSPQVVSSSEKNKQNNDEVTIRTYAGLNATTQERIRRFEQETKAMLQRDQHKQRREAEKREEEKRRIEMKWQLAKREMEHDDLLDDIVDTTVAPKFLTERLTDEPSTDTPNVHSRSKSIARITPLSIAVQQQPTARQKAQATNQLNTILGEKMNNGINKKLKTDKEVLSYSATSEACLR